MDDKGTAQLELSTTVAAPAPTPVPDHAAVIAALSTEATEAKRQLAQFKTDQEAARAKLAEEQAAQGDHRQKADFLASKVIELEKQLAESSDFIGYGKTWHERETKRITDVSAQMDESWKRTLDAIPSLQGKADYVALFQQTQTQAVDATGTPRAKPHVMGTAAAAATRVDLVKMLNERSISLEDAEKKYPQEYAAQISASVSSISKPKRKAFGLG